MNPNSQPIVSRTILVAVLALVLDQPHQIFAGDAAIELLVKWKDGPNSLAAIHGNAQIGSTVKRNFNALGWQLVELPAGLRASDAIKTYKTLDAILTVEPNGRMSAEPPLPASTD